MGNMRHTPKKHEENKQQAVEQGNKTAAAIASMKESYRLRNEQIQQNVATVQKAVKQAEQRFEKFKTLKKGVEKRKNAQQYAHHSQKAVASKTTKSGHNEVVAPKVASNSPDSPGLISKLVATVVNVLRWLGIAPSPKAIANPTPNVTPTPASQPQQVPVPVESATFAQRERSLIPTPKPKSASEKSVSPEQSNKQSNIWSKMMKLTVGACSRRIKQAEEREMAWFRKTAPQPKPEPTIEPTPSGTPSFRSGR